MKKLTILVLAATMGAASCGPMQSQEEGKKQVENQLFTQTMQRTVNITEIREAQLSYRIVLQTTPTSADGYRDYPLEVLVASDPEGIKGYINMGINANLHKGAATITYKKFKQGCVNAQPLLQYLTNAPSDVKIDVGVPQVCAEGVITAVKYE